MNEDLLDIPAFLRQQDATPKPLARPSSNPERAKPPEGFERYEILNSKHTLLLHPGARTIWAKVGWKWVKVWRGPKRRRVKLQRHVFDRMVESRQRMDS